MELFKQRFQAPSHLISPQQISAIGELVDATD